ncbi:unnamed protein product [Effrenium voratum]|nr:unnamed protein product [Effrenium voratum]
MGHLAFGRLGAASAVVHQCLRQRLRSLQQQRASRSEDIFFFGGRGFSGLALDVAARFSPGEEEWQALPPLPTARWAAAAAALGQELLVMGGYSDGADTDVVDCFDPFRSSWRSPSNLKLSCPRSESAAVGLEGRVYLVAGTSFGQELDLLERCDGGGWEPLAPLPSPRSGCCAAACGAKLFVVGGFAGGYTLRRAECLDAEWRLLPPAMTARWSGAAASVCGKIYVCGGYNGGLPLGTVERFDPLFERWEVVAPLPTPRKHLVAARSATSLYVLGGFDGTAPTAVVEYLGAEWEPCVPLPVASEWGSAVSLGLNPASARL